MGRVIGVVLAVEDEDGRDAVAVAFVFDFGFVAAESAFVPDVFDGAPVVVVMHAVVAARSAAASASGMGGCLNILRCSSKQLQGQSTPARRRRAAVPANSPDSAGVG
jgi:hypothetical protein